MNSSPSVYVFPKTTCERPSGGFIQQPFSVAVNALILVFLLYVLYVEKYRRRSEPWIGFGFIWALVVLEMLHMGSHWIHWNPLVQTLTIHGMSWVVLGFLWATLWVRLKIAFDIRVVIMAFAWCLDVYLLLYVRNWISVVSGVSLIGLLLVLYLPNMPADWRPWVLGLLILGILGGILFYAEYRYCTSWMNRRVFPYHVFNELVVGTFIVGLVGLLIWDHRNQLA